MAAATSMAAALAASLPAPSAAPAPAAPTYEAIPASMSKVIDLEGEIPLQSVQLDGLVSYDVLSFPRVRVALHRAGVALRQFPVLYAVRRRLVAGRIAPTGDVRGPTARAVEHEAHITLKPVSYVPLPRVQGTNSFTSID